MSAGILGKNIKEILYNKRMSQIELAEKIGVHKQILSNWIRGIRNPKEENLERIAKALDTTVKNLLEENNKNSFPTPLERANSRIEELEEKLKFKDEQIEFLKEKLKFAENKE